MINSPQQKSNAVWWVALLFLVIAFLLYCHMSRTNDQQIQKLQQQIEINKKQSKADVADEKRKREWSEKMEVQRREYEKQQEEYNARR